MSSEFALRVEQLGKCYPMYSHPRDRLLQALYGQRRQLYRPFWALQDVSFVLPPGRTLGVVGRNGSGKSTLLQLICGTLTPSSGSVEARGRIGALQVYRSIEMVRRYGQPRFSCRKASIGRLSTPNHGSATPIASFIFWPESYARWIHKILKCQIRFGQSKLFTLIDTGSTK